MGVLATGIGETAEAVLIGMGVAMDVESRFTFFAEVLGEVGSDTVRLYLVSILPPFVPLP